MIIEIEDDFDPQKIINSGQCFRAAEISKGEFRFISNYSILYIRKLYNHLFEVSCDQDEWNQVWKQYFDLQTNYSSIRKQISKDDIFLTKAASTGSGIRILRQDPWETLITFIISQRKSIPSIRNCVDLLSTHYGQTIETESEILHLFPTHNVLCELTEAELSICKLGYRIPYIMDAALKVETGTINLQQLSYYNTHDLLNVLMGIHGVGPKIAKCVALFAYGRKEVVPVDTWIKKVIQDEYAGYNKLSDYGAVAGVMQQYAFFYQTHRRRML